MKKRSSLPFFLLIFICAAACSNQQNMRSGDEHPTLSNYFQAFNNHDVEGLAATVTDDIRLMSITADTVITDLSGKEQLKNWLSGYFSSLPNVTSRYSDVTVREPFVSFVETAKWGPDSARKQQSSLATYQIKEGKIHRVWYYYPE